MRDVDIIIAVNKHELDTTPEIQAIMQKAQQTVQQHAMQVMQKIQQSMQARGGMPGMPGMPPGGGMPAGMSPAAAAGGGGGQVPGGRVFPKKEEDAADLGW